MIVLSKKSKLCIRHWLSKTIFTVKANLFSPGTSEQIFVDKYSGSM